MLQLDHRQVPRVLLANGFTIRSPNSIAGSISVHKRDIKCSTRGSISVHSLSSRVTSSALAWRPLWYFLGIHDATSEGSLCGRDETAREKPGKRRSACVACGPRIFSLRTTEDGRGRAKKDLQGREAGGRRRGKQRNRRRMRVLMILVVVLSSKRKLPLREWLTWFCNYEDYQPEFPVCFALYLLTLWQIVWVDC